MNEHADFVMQTDDSFGKIVQALKNNGLLENTLIICSSDNGTSAPTSKLAELQAKGHYPSGDLRGSKADIWDGGHRVPFLVSWPGVVEPGSRCDKLTCLTGVGEQTNVALKQPDTVKALRALLDQQIAHGRSTPGLSQANDVKIVVDKQPGRKKKNN